MPTILNDTSDHPSLSSLSLGPFTNQYPPPATSPPPPPPSQQHYHHRFPSHFHPTYQSQFQHLPSPSDHPPQIRQQIRRRPSSSTKPPGSSFTRSTTATTHGKKKTLIPSKPSSFNKYNQHKYFNQGPKWIHRQGVINGINYHWVETTSHSDDEDNNIKPTDKPLVILLHGFPQFWYTWRHQIVPLGEAGYRVVAPDLRGFNLTDKPVAPKRKTGTKATATTSSTKSSSNVASNNAGNNNRDDDDETKQSEDTYDMETLTSDIRALILHLGHEEASIVGHDWGGIIAWAFAARFPRHVSKLVVMNAPHLCRWRDVATDYSSASCFEQTWWTCWYSMCCQLLPSWIPEAVLSYQRSWILTYNMTSSPSFANPLSCISTARSITAEGANYVCSEQASSTSADRPDAIAVPGGGGCAACWKSNDMDLYRDAISQPGAIYALLEYYRNLWLSIQQMEQYGKIRQGLPILVLWGLKDKNFPKETYAQGWDEWIEHGTGTNADASKPPALTVSYLDCGHFTPEEKPAEVNKQLLHFLGQPAQLQV